MDYGMTLFVVRENKAPVISKTSKAISKICMEYNLIAPTSFWICLTGSLSQSRKPQYLRSLFFIALPFP